MVKNPPAKAGDTRDVSSTLGQEDPLEKEMATQYSCLENSRDRGASWATVHGAAKSWTQLCMHPHTDKI